MRRLNYFASLLFVAGAAACGPNHNASLCDGPNPPAECAQECDPAGANTCPAGFHCNLNNSTCDAECTPGGTECGDNAHCSADGACIADNGSNTPVDANCPAVHFTATPVTPSIELVIDRSGSMDGTDISPTRYKAIQKGLVDATTGIVVTEQAHVIFGAAMFAGDQEPCLSLNGFTAPRAINNAQAITDLLANNPPNGGNTPTAPAIDQVVADFAANPPPADSPPIILLATDGEPNSCDGNGGSGPSIQSTQAAYAAGIRLFILGLANLNTGYLQQMANAGAGVTAGMPDAPFFTADDPASLQTALHDIIVGALSCDLALTGTGTIDPNSAMNGVVTLDGMTLVFGTDWTIVNGNTLELLGAACDAFKASDNPQVDATFSCGDIIQ